MLQTEVLPHVYRLQDGKPTKHLFGNLGRNEHSFKYFAIILYLCLCTTYNVWTLNFDDLCWPVIRLSRFCIVSCFNENMQRMNKICLNTVRIMHSTVFLFFLTQLPTWVGTQKLTRHQPNTKLSQLWSKKGLYKINISRHLDYLFLYLVYQCK